ncbi:OmpA family protein [Flavihumibacter sp. R14]|nr:OmpA family protein [Flavihumibacter soli]
MNLSKLKLANFILALTTVVVLFGACKAKKAVVAEQPPVVEQEKPAQPAPVEEKEVAVAPTPAPEKMPDFNYSNIQFEFNSSILKTASYAVLDQIAGEMKKYDTVRFNIEGHASQEGTDQRNMTLSVDRANAVKAYLINAGVNGENLTSVGFGETKPVASNANEEGRVLNRRVEIKKN